MHRTIKPIDKFNISVAASVFCIFYSALLLHPGSTLLRDTDTLWHIRIGQWILENAKVPVVDFYSYTGYGHRWIAGQWLAEILLALAFNAAQWRGVVILGAATCAAIIALLCLYLIRNLRFSVAIGWAALTELALTAHFLARPHIFSYILLVIWVIILIDSYDSEDFRPSTLVLCLLMILWANMHGSFIIGLLLLYVFAGFSCYEKFVEQDYVRCRRILLAVFVVSASALLTPYGVYSALLVFQLMNMKFLISHASEWLSPDFQAYPYFLFYLVGLLGALAGLGVRLHGPRLVAFCMMLFLGLSHVRGLFMFFLLAPIILARPISARVAWFRADHLVDGQSSEAAKPLDQVLLYLRKRPVTMPAIFLTLAAVVTAHSWQEINIGPSKSKAPSAAIEFVRKAGITGNVFNSQTFGDYLIFVGIPSFTDGRIPPTDDFMRRHYNALFLEDINDAFRLLDEYKVHWALLEPDAPLAKALAQSNLWDKVYSDNYSVVLVRHQ
jgi:hypothetical protein